MTQHDQPEYLDSRGGAPLQTEAGRRRTRRTVAVVIGAVALAVVGGGAWAVWSFFSTGAQPAEALPASTIAYASVDLDPSGGQKIEALKTLRKLPVFKDEVGLDSKDDVREWLVDEIADDAGCDLDFDDDVEPWLGDRFAVAAVDAGDKTPAPIFVLQVTDDDGADGGLTKLQECGAGDLAWSIADGWALVGETQEIVDDAAADAPLSEDGDFQRWTDEAGDSGIVSLYAAPAAGEVLAQNLDGLVTPSIGAGLDGGIVDEGDDVLPDELKTAFTEFQGAAATLRFDDGGLELEVAADSDAWGEGLSSGDGAGDVVASLPEETVAALGVSFGDGWFDDLMKQVAAEEGGSADELMAEAGEALGLDLPGDAETLAGDSLALAVDGDFDPESFFVGSAETLSGVGVKILGDADEIDGVLEKVRSAAAGQDGGILDSDAGDGAVAVGPDADYRAQLVEDGGLGDSDSFQHVVEHAGDAAAVLYVDFDAGDDWLAEFAGDDDARENLEPLDALGLSSWQDGDTTHAVLKVTTD